MKKPKGLTAEQLAEVLTREYGEPVPVAYVLADIENGAPVNPDGTMNLILYCAWLLRTDKRGRR